MEENEGREIYKRTYRQAVFIALFFVFFTLFCITVALISTYEGGVWYIWMCSLGAVSFVGMVLSLVMIVHYTPHKSVQYQDYLHKTEEDDSEDEDDEDDLTTNDFNVLDPVDIEKGRVFIVTTKFGEKRFLTVNGRLKIASGCIEFEKFGE